jgi:hypothetical protein
VSSDLLNGAIFIRIPAGDVNRVLALHASARQVLRQGPLRGGSHSELEDETSRFNDRAKGCWPPIIPIAKRAFESISDTPSWLWFHFLTS